MTYRSSAFVSIQAPTEIVASLAAHAKEHDALVEHPTPVDLKIIAGQSTIHLSAKDTGLAVQVSASSQGMLYFMKESAVRHLSDLCPKAAEALRWQDSGAAPAPSGRPPSFFEMTVLRKSYPISGMLRLHLTGSRDMSALCGPGIHVKLMLPAVPGRDPVWPTTAENGTTRWPENEDALHVRYYTIQSCSLKPDEAAIDIVRHPGGFTSEWAEGALPGDKIGLLGPAGGELLPKSTRVLLAGDKTALPALARTVSTLETDTSGHLVGEAETIEDLVAYLPPNNLTVHALAPDRFQAEIVNYCEVVVGQNKPQFAWFAGEYTNAQNMRKYFKSDLGLKKGNQFSIAYWRKGSEFKAN